MAEVSEAEKTRIEALDLANDPEIGPWPWFVRRGWWSSGWTLRHRPDGRCVFLTSANRCRLQERFGAAAKPFVCRLFPFVMIPAGDQWRVGLRFACPSAAGNVGRAISAHQSDLAQLAPLLESHVGRTAESGPPPPLRAGQSVSWPDLLRFVHTLVDMVHDRGSRLERRLRQCLALSRVCRKARFEKLGGERLDEFLQVVRTGLEAEVPFHATDLAEPGRLGQLMFRSLLAIFARRDVGLHRGAETRTRLARVNAGWRFVRGTGRVPRVNAFLPETTFEAVANRPGLPPEVDATLERYYAIKLGSLQFCGAPNLGLPLWDGLESLIVTMPMISWLARACSDLEPVAAVEQSLILVDDHFGGNPILGFRHNRFFVETLASNGDLDKVVAWYGR